MNLCCVILEPPFLLVSFDFLQFINMPRPAKKDKTLAMGVFLRTKTAHVVTSTPDPRQQAPVYDVYQPDFPPRFTTDVISGGKSMPNFAAGGYANHPTSVPPVHRPPPMPQHFSSPPPTQFPTGQQHNTPFSAHDAIGFDSAELLTWVPIPKFNGNKKT